VCVDKLRPLSGNRRIFPTRTGRKRLVRVSSAEKALLVGDLERDDICDLFLTQGGPVPIAKAGLAKSWEQRQGGAPAMAVLTQMERDVGSVRVFWIP
jgi:hypothetical protein